MTSAPNVWLVIVNFNGLADTKVCLRSVTQLTTPVSVVVVDNASVEDPIPELSAEFPDYHYLSNGANLGFAGGNNRGIDYALARGADWVMLLNNDTTVAPALVERLLHSARTRDGIGIIGPVINAMAEPGTVMTDGCVFNSSTFDGFFERKPIDVRDSAAPRLTDVDIVNGCCMMLSAPMLRAIGLIDERFFLVHEESDLCLRACKAGFGCAVIDSALVWHKGSSSFRRAGTATQRYYDARNLLLLLAKHDSTDERRKSPWRSRWSYLRYVFFRYAIEREEGRPSGADAVVEGVCDALARRYGPRSPRRRTSTAFLGLAFEVCRRRPRFAAIWRDA